tara:strand:+ start:249 stop:434 length:186 start_codon:yes stop_codon:yes gene_type:complete
MKAKFRSEKDYTKFAGATCFFCKDKETDTKLLPFRLWEKYMIHSCEGCYFENEEHLKDVSK